MREKKEGKRYEFGERVEEEEEEEVLFGFNKRRSSLEFNGRGRRKGLLVGLPPL